MTHTVYYTGEFRPVERSVRKLDRVVDVWLRRNPREAEDGMKMADELYLAFPADNAPSLEELTENLDNYFMDDATPDPTMQDVVEALNELAELILGGE